MKLACLSFLLVRVTLWTHLIADELSAKIQETAAETLSLSFHPSYLRSDSRLGPDRHCSSETNFALHEPCIPKLEKLSYFHKIANFIRACSGFEVAY
jgi:hypothetical protein